MTTASYHIGDLRRLSASFADRDGQAFDPDDVTFVMTEPDGVSTSYTRPQAGPDNQIVRTAAGSYYVDWLIAKAGRHSLEWRGTGANATAEPAEIYGLRKQAV